jgi:hypothetical protein
MNTEQLIIHYGAIITVIAGIMERLVALDKKKMNIDLSKQVKLVFFRTSQLRLIGAVISVLATLGYTIYTGLGFWEFLIGSAVVFMGEYGVGKVGIRNAVKFILWIKNALSGKG